MSSIAGGASRRRALPGRRPWQVPVAALGLSLAAHAIVLAPWTEKGGGARSALGSPRSLHVTLRADSDAVAAAARSAPTAESRNEAPLIGAALHPEARPAPTGELRASRRLAAAVRVPEADVARDAPAGSALGAFAAAPRAESGAAGAAPIAPAALALPVTVEAPVGPAGGAPLRGSNDTTAGRRDTRPSPAGDAGSRPTSEPPSLPAISRASADEAQTPTNDDARAVDLSGYLGQVRERLAEKMQYPSRARRRRQEGTVTVHFVVDSDGAVLRHRIHTGSGHALLDRAAEDLVLAASPLPPPPLGSQPLELALPIEYRLQ